MTPLVFALAASLSGVAFDPGAPAGDSKRVVALAVAVVLVAWALLSRPMRQARPHAAQSVLLGAVCVSAVSLSWGTPRGALDLGTWVAGCAIACAASSRGRLFSMRAARSAGVVLGGVLAIVAVVGFVRGARGIAIDGGQGNANWLGLALCVTLPLAVDAARRSNRLAIASVALQALSLGASHARVAWVAGGLALVVLSFGQKSRRGWLGAVFVLAVVGAFAARGTSTQSTGKQASSLPYEAPADVAVRGRWSIAKTTMRASVAAFPFGVGLGRFADAFRDAQSAELAHVPPKSAARVAVNATTGHDEPLQIATESGPLAAALVMVGLVLAVRGLRSFRAGMASIVAVSVCALADDPLRKPAVVVIVALVLAALPHGKTRVRRAPSLAVAIAACALLLVPAVRAWRSDRLVAAAEVSPLARGALSRAAHIDPGSADAAFALGLSLLDAGALEAARASLVRARSLDDDAATSIALGNVELASGDDVAAEAAFRRAIARSPGSFRAHVGVAEALRRQGRLDDAIGYARIARTIRPFDVALTDLEERLADDGAS